MNRKVKKIWNIITSVLTAVIVITAILLVGVRLFGFKVFSVLSGSMEPLYPVGSLIYVKDADYKQLKPGDVITFRLNEDTVATHRIKEVIKDSENPGEISFVTKGDANDVPDGKPVYYKNIIGVPVFKLPKLGYAAAYISSPSGRYASVAVCAFILLAGFLPDIISGGRKKTKEPDKQ